MTIHSQISRLDSARLVDGHGDAALLCARGHQRRAALRSQRRHLTGPGAKGGQHMGGFNGDTPNGWFFWGKIILLKWMKKWGYPYFRKPHTWGGWIWWIYSIKIGIKPTGYGYFMVLGYVITSICCFQWGVYEPTAISKSMLSIAGCLSWAMSYMGVSEKY